MTVSQRIVQRLEKRSPNQKWRKILFAPGDKHWCATTRREKTTGVAEYASRIRRFRQGVAGFWHNTRADSPCVISTMKLYALVAMSRQLRL